MKRRRTITQAAQKKFTTNLAFACSALTAPCKTNCHPTTFARLYFISYAWLRLYGGLGMPPVNWQHLSSMPSYVLLLRNIRMIRQTNESILTAIMFPLVLQGAREEGKSSLKLHIKTLELWLILFNLFNNKAGFTYALLILYNKNGPVWHYVLVDAPLLLRCGSFPTRGA